MTKLARYCKAYHVRDLRQSPEWQKSPAATQYPEDAIVFVHEDLAVTAGIVRGEDILLETSESAWNLYCRDVLKFEAPSWCQSALTPTGR